jgi:hypothetical protein
MKLGIVALLLLVPVSACAGEQDPGSQPSEPGTKVVLVSESDGGGADVSQQLTPLDTPQRLEAFATQFEDHLAARIRSEAARVEVPSGEVLAGALAYVGCGTPKQAEVSDGDNGLELVPQQTNDENIQCIVAVTTVGLVPVAAGDV